MPKQLVIILGMHRSGTSFVTKSIELLGYSLGDNIMPARKDNPKGFFEDLDIVTFNEALLETQYSAWDNPLPLDPKRLLRNRSMVSRARELLKEKFTDTDRLVIKDPRMSLLVEFWAPQFDAEGISTRYLVVHRNPLDIAASLKARNGFSIRHGLLLTYFYFRKILQFCGDKSFVVGYPQFLQEPTLELNRISSHFGDTVSAVEFRAFFKEFVDLGLCHHEHNQSDLELASDSFDELSTINRFFLDSIIGQTHSVTAWLQETKSSLDSLSLEFMQSFSILSFKRERELEKKLQSIALKEGNSRADVKLLNAEVKDREKQLEERDLQLSERNQHLQILQQEIKVLGNQRDQSNAILAKQEQDLKTQAVQLKDRQKYISALQLEVGDLTVRRDRANEVLQRWEKEIATLKEEVSKQDVEISSQNQAMALRQEELSQALAAIDSMNHHQSWLEEQIAGYQQHLMNFERLHGEVLNSVSFRLGRLVTFPLRKPILWMISRHQDNRRLLAVISLLRRFIARPIVSLKLLSPTRIKNFFVLMSKRQDLIEQAIGRYAEILTEKPRMDDTKVHHYSTEELAEISMCFPQPASPLVSVVIPVYNQLDYTLKCLKSIQLFMPQAPIEVIVADDCSTDDTKRVLSEVNGLHYLCHPKNLGFLRSCNRAIDFCQGKYIYLLNNDTTVRNGWIDSLLSVFEKHQDAGLVGSKLLYPDGKLQEAGGIIWKDGTGWNFGRGQDPDLPEYCYLREVDYVSGAAIMFPRELFLSLGRFDERYVPAYYEDTDLAFRIREAGKKVYLQPRSEIIHYEGISHGTDENAGIKAYQVANQERFFERWQTVLEADHFDNAVNVFRARERNYYRRTVLVIDHYVPHFDNDAGSRSTYQYLELMVRAGLKVIFLGDNFFRHEPYTTVLQDMGIEVVYGNWYQNNWQSWLVQHVEAIDVIYMMRPHIAEKYIDIVNKLKPKPKTIYFGHDLHYLRLERQAELSGDGAAMAEASHWKEKEYKLFQKFDLIYYPSQVEIDEIHSKDPALPVKAIPLYAFAPLSEDPVDPAKRTDLLFVGGFNHPPNADGLNWFMEDVFPSVLDNIPDLRIHIVGSKMPDEIRDLASNSVVVHGFISDEELEDLYSRIRMSVVPLRFGAGMKGKVLESLYYGVPLITTSIGAEGIPGSSDAMFVADDADEMSRCLIEGYCDLEKLSELSASGKKIINAHFSTDTVLGLIEKDFIVS